jgi:bifunctional non-homologous end joining protein LigD
MSVLGEMRSRLTVVEGSKKIQPCLPTTAAQPPSGPGWIHEIKHDGYRMMLRRDAAGIIRLITRGGYNWSERYPLIASAAGALKAKSFLIDGEAVACDEAGLAEFQRLRRRADDRSVFLYAFDLLELNGADLRREPIEGRKEALSKLLRLPLAGIRYCDHLDIDDGELVYAHACALGCEGIVSKRKGSTYRAGRSRDWIKVNGAGREAQS